MSKNISGYIMLVLNNYIYSKVFCIYLFKYTEYITTSGKSWYWTRIPRSSKNPESVQKGKTSYGTGVKKSTERVEITRSLEGWNIPNYTITSLFFCDVGIMLIM